MRVVDRQRGVGICRAAVVRCEHERPQSSESNLGFYLIFRPKDICDLGTIGVCVAGTEHHQDVEVFFFGDFRQILEVRHSTLHVGTQAVVDQL